MTQNADGKSTAARWVSPIGAADNSTVPAFVCVLCALGNIEQTGVDVRHANAFESCYFADAGDRDRAKLERAA